MPAPDSRAGWWSRAACSASDPELFFPASSSGSAALTQVRRAKVICAACEIQQACLEYALAAGPIQGVWGGTTEEERRWLSNGSNRAGPLPRCGGPDARIAG
jgi:WhiB family transcriptional regulator, redox-sensing transcriptional regulator